MGQGFAGVAAAAAEIDRKKNEASEGGSFMRRFRLGDGESAVVRFLEEKDDVKWAWVCQIPPTGNQKWGPYVPSRDQSPQGNGEERCPLAERGLPRQFRGWINLIWRNAPVFARDANNRMIKNAQGVYEISGYADQIAVWEAGITVFQDLYELDMRYGGLASRDFEVKRTGTSLKTKYSIHPAVVDGGPQPMSEADSALATQKYDLVPIVTPKSYEEIAAMLSGGPVQSTAQAVSEGQVPTNPFL